MFLILLLGFLLWKERKNFFSLTSVPTTEKRDIVLTIFSVDKERGLVLANKIQKKMSSFLSLQEEFCLNIKLVTGLSIETEKKVFLLEEENNPNPFLNSPSYFFLFVLFKKQNTLLSENTFFLEDFDYEKAFFWFFTSLKENQKKIKQKNIYCENLFSIMNTQEHRMAVELPLLIPIITSTGFFYIKLFKTWLSKKKF